MRIATWNINSLRMRLGHVTQWLEREQPDVLALQETKLRDEDFPVEAFAALGYQVVFSGQPAYNGVAIASRRPAANVLVGLEGFEDPARRVLAASFGELRVFNVYVPNGQRVGSEKYAYKLEWMAALRDQLARELERHGQLVLLGDFNVAPEDRDVHDPLAWEGKIMCSEPERSALAAIRALGLHDAFRLFEQPPRSFTWWDYRAGAFRRNLGLRIDLILLSEQLRERCAGCRIDAAPRRWEKPSDHVPVVADLRLP
ncbi:MAG TPA: exodeoxyribonuclease III [Gammaproteobacteria bacterium]